MPKQNKSEKPLLYQKIKKAIEENKGFMWKQVKFLITENGFKYIYDSKLIAEKKPDGLHVYPRECTKSITIRLNYLLDIYMLPKVFNRRGVNFFEDGFPYGNRVNDISDTYYAVYSFKDHTWVEEVFNAEDIAELKEYVDNENYFIIVSKVPHEND